MEDVAVKNVVWHPRTLKISQIPKQGLEYAFVSEDYIQIHQLVWCKDFMQDVVFGHLHQKKVSIYGFRYDPKHDPPLYMDKTRIMVNSYKDADLGSEVLVNLKDFLHQIEDHLKMARTVFELVANPPHQYRRSGVFILDSSKRWMKSPPMMSLYTLLLRTGLLHQPGDDPLDTIRKIRNRQVAGYFDASRSDGKDFEILRDCQRGIETILKYGDRKLFFRNIKDNYPARHGTMTTSMYNIHDGWGLTGFSKKNTRFTFPHWHRFDKDENLVRK